MAAGFSSNYDVIVVGRALWYGVIVAWQKTAIQRWRNL